MGLVTTACAKPAQAHVAPSVKENNRYIKLTLLGDRVRLAYIIYIGEIPGQSARRRMDVNRDGKLSDAESAAFRDQWADRVREALAIELGGEHSPVSWDSVEIGLGTPLVTGGAMSIDLVDWLCLEGRARRLELRDRLVVPRPGESQLLVEESPGTEITSASIGDQEQSELTWTGASSRLANGARVEWNATADAVGGTGPCSAASASSATNWWPYLAGAAAIAIAILLLLARTRRKR